MAPSSGGTYPWDGLPNLDDDGTVKPWRPTGNDGYLCLVCLNNETLAWVWGTEAIRGVCVYCGGSSSGGIRSVHNLLTYVYRSLRFEYIGGGTSKKAFDDKPDEERFTTTGLLGTLNEPLGPDILLQLAQSLPHGWWPIDGSAGPIESRMVESWQDFSTKVRRGPRFGFGGATVSSDPHHVDDVLRFFGDSIAHMDGHVVKILDPGLTLHRARLARHGPHHTAEELGSPPLNKAGPQRMSAAGVPCFYAAEKPETAVAELRTVEPVSIGRWRTSTPFRFLELSEWWPMPSLFNPVTRSSRSSVRFVRDFEAEISNPADDVIGDANSYLPTQIFAEYLRYSLPTQFGQGVDAIRYRSVARPGGVNWCIFGQPDRQAVPAVEFLDAVRFSLGRAVRQVPEQRHPRADGT